jgi:hypothetical protein
VTYYYHAGNAPEQKSLLQASIDEAVDGLPFRSGAERSISAMIASQGGRRSSGLEQRLLVEVLALLIDFGLERNEALARVRSMTPKSAGAATEPADRDSPCADPVLAGDARHDLAVWWAVRLCERKREVFSHAKWEHDCAMWRLTTPISPRMGTLLSGLYGPKVTVASGC